MAAVAAQAFGNSAHLINAFAAMSLHIKGMGFRREEILEVVGLFGENSLDKANWMALQSLKSYTKDMETAVYAYKAGLSPYDVQNLSDEELSLESLKIMAQIKSL
jgi:hypothetical protein